MADIGDISAIVFDASDSLLLGDRALNVIRKITPDGVINTIAGTGAFDYAGDGGSALSAAFRGIAALATDSAGNIYVADALNARVRKIDTANKITTIAGDGHFDDSGDNGPAANARFFLPTALALDKDGGLLVADALAGRVRKIKDGRITGFAGTGWWGPLGDGGQATAAMLLSPTALAFDSAGSLYIADAAMDHIRKLAPNGIISTFAGTGVYSFGGDGGELLMADFANPTGMVVNSRNNLLVVDTDNHRIRLLDSITVNTIAGKTHFEGDGGPAKSAQLFYPKGVARDINGNLYVSDKMNHAIRRIDPSGGISTVAGIGLAGYKGDTGKATAARLRAPVDLAFGGDGKLYIADYGNSRIRMVSTGGDIVTLAGNGSYKFNGDGGARSVAFAPNAVAVDSAGNIYIADPYNNRIYKVTPDAMLSTYAGTGDADYGGDGGLATAAKLQAPTDIVLDKAGNLYVADSGNYRVRKITPAGMISTFAGTGTCCFTGDGGPASAAGMEPKYLAMDAFGNMYVADSTRIRKISTTGTINTIAGKTTAGLKGDGGPATEALLNGPTGMAMDDAGSVYFADSQNHRIRKLTVNAAARLEMVRGNDQKGPVGTTLPTPLTVRLVGSAEVGMAGVAVNFAVTDGTATLSSTAPTTDPSGLAAISVTLPKTAGTATITASVTGLAPVKFTVTATGVETAPPVVAGGGIVSAGGSIPAVTTLAPLGLARITGSQFAPAGTDRKVTAEDLVNGRIPTNVAGVCLQVGTEFAPLFRVTDTRIDIQVPNLAAPADVPVQVVLNCGKPDEVRSVPQTVSLRAASPEFFYFVQNPDGHDPVQAVNMQTGVNTGAPDLVAGQTFVPAAPYDTISLFATGLGLTDPPFAAGEIPDHTVPLILPVVVTLGDRQLDAVLYAGVAPGSAGLYRVDIQIPGDTAEGDLPLLLQVGDFTSPAGAYLTVKKPPTDTP